MVSWAFSDFLVPLYTYLVAWYTAIIERLSGASVIIAAAAIVLCVSFLVMPLRGSGISDLALPQGKSDNSRSLPPGQYQKRLKAGNSNE